MPAHSAGKLRLYFSSLSLALLLAVVLQLPAGAQPSNREGRVVTIDCRLGEHKTDGTTHELEDGVTFVALHWAVDDDREIVPRLDPVYLTNGLSKPDGYSLKFPHPLKIVDVENCVDHRDIFQPIRTKDRRELIFRTGNPGIIVKLLREIRSVILIDPKELQQRIDRAGNAERYQEVQELIAAAEHLGIPMDLGYQKEWAYFNDLRDRGFQEFSEKQYQDAISHLGPVTEERPDDFEAGLILAKAQYQLGQYDDARHQLERLRRQNPSQPEVLLQLGLVELTRQEFELAAEHLRKAHEAGAREAPFYLGFALYKLDDRDTAKSVLQEYLARNPTSERASQARALIDSLEGEIPGSRPGSGSDQETRVADAGPTPMDVPPPKPEVFTTSPPPAQETEPASPEPRESVVETPGDPSLAGSPLIFRGFRRGPLPLAEYRDKVTVVHLWASWCGPCVHELPSLIEFHREDFAHLQEAGVELIVLSVDFDEKALATYVDDKMPDLAELPLYWDPNWTLATELELDSALPKTLLVDRGGRIHRIQRGSLDWRSDQLVAELHALAEGAASGP